MTNQKADWEKEFDNKFGGYFEPSVDSFRFYSQIKSFIRSLLAAREAEVRKEIKEEVEELFDLYFRGLLLIPEPQATKKQLLRLILAVIEK